jgi:hypothetical protein
MMAVIFTVMATSLIAVLPASAAISVSLSTTSGSPGDQVNITGTGFTPGFTINSIVFAPSTFYGQTLLSNVTVAGSEFTQPIIIPPSPWAQQTITVNTSQGTFLLNFQIVPEIEVDRLAGYVGDTVVVSGNGFRANATVVILFNTTATANTSTDLYGSLAQTSFQVPAVRSGGYNVNGNDSAAATTPFVFTVRARVTASTTQGSVGDQITLSGSGFDYNSALVFYWDTQLVTTNQVVTGATGLFTAPFTIPLGTTGGHTLRVADLSGRYADLTVNINPSITLTPSIGVPGGTVTINARGFRPNSSIAVTYNGLSLATQPAVVTSDANGSFTATFTVPNGVSGSYIVRATDGTFAAQTALNVALIITLNPATGNVGSNVQIIGTGFTPLGRIAISYDTQDMTTVAADTTGAFTATITIPASKAGAHTVSARDLAVPSLVSTAAFTMESTPPPKPNLLTPANGTQTTTTPAFTWSAVSDPSGVTYSLQAASDAGFASVVLAKQGLTSPSYTLAGTESLGLVKSNTPYYWRIKAIDGAGNDSDWTAAFSFYTQDSTAPAAPLLTTPPNDTQAEVRPAFKWSDVSDPSGVSYSLQVSRDTGFTLLAINKTGLTTAGYQTAQSEQFELVKRLAPYYWRVKATDGAGNESSWSAPSTFYTQDSTAPAAPVALKPENSSQQGGQPQFTWTVVTDPSGVTYTVQVAQDAAFSQLVVVKDGLQTAQYKLISSEKLSSSDLITYYWRVKATDGAGNDGGWSNINQFKVKNFLQSGWPVYIAIGVGGLLLVVIGLFIGTRLKKQPLKE